MTLATDYLQAQKLRTRAMVHLRQVFKHADLFVTPTTAITAPPLRCAPLRGLLMSAGLASLAVQGVGKWSTLFGKVYR